MAKPEVGIVMGSDSDWPDIKAAAETLEGFGIACEICRGRFRRDGEKDHLAAVRRAVYSSYQHK